MQLTDRVTHIKEWQQPRRMPGGTRRELGAFQQHDIRPSLQGQMIERADADHAAAYDDDTGMSFHVS